MPTLLRQAGAWQRQSSFMTNRIIFAGPLLAFDDGEVSDKSRALATAQRYFLPDGCLVMLGGDMLELDAQTLSAYARALEAFGLT